MEPYREDDVKGWGGVRNSGSTMLLEVLNIKTRFMVFIKLL